MSLFVFQGAVELGLIYSIMALGVFLSFRTLNTPDLTVDGSIVTGASVSAVLCLNGVPPIISLIAAFIAGCLAGSITALLNTKLKIQPLLAGILVMLALYSVNMHIMGNRANLALINQKTVYSNDISPIIVGLIVLIIVFVLFYLFLKTRTGFALRATGDNENMVRASGIDSAKMRLLGLSLSNGLVGLSGGMLAQYQSFVDIGMGVGMVVIGLASVIIGEAIFGRKTLLRRLISVVLGAILYRVVISLAIGVGMNPIDLKLISAGIVTIALAIGLFGEKFSLKSLIRKKKND